MRSKRAPKRVLAPDEVYHSRLVHRLINLVMHQGKKNAARKSVYSAFKIVKHQADTDPLEIFKVALDNLKPTMEVRPRRVGGAAYQVPMPVKGNRRESLALRWLVIAARSLPNKQYHTFADKLAAEIINAYNNEGAAIKRRFDTHRMAEANKVFAHFRW